jgi:hypothetical protein
MMPKRSAHFPMSPVSVVLFGCVLEETSGSQSRFSDSVGPVKGGLEVDQIVGQLNGPNARFKMDSAEPARGWTNPMAALPSIPSPRMKGKTYRRHTSPDCTSLRACAGLEGGWQTSRAAWRGTPLLLSLPIGH